MCAKNNPFVSKSMTEGRTNEISGGSHMIIAKFLKKNNKNCTCYSINPSSGGFQCKSSRSLFLALIIRPSTIGPS